MPDQPKWGTRGPRPEGVPARFAAKVDQRGPDECWPWTGAVDRKGYALFAGGRRLGHGTRGHRYAYALANGPIPEGASVLHRCDNPPCCNPRHLFLGTIADNNEDARSKGRAYRFGDEDRAKSGKSRRKEVAR